MRNTILVAAAMFCFASLSTSQEVGELNFHKLEKGQSGNLPSDPTGVVGLKVDEIVSLTELVAKTRTDIPSRPSVAVLIKGVDTDGLVDGKPVKFTGRFKVTGTKRVRGYGTIFVLEKQ